MPTARYGNEGVGQRYQWAGGGERGNSPETHTHPRCKSAWTDNLALCLFPVDSTECKVRTGCLRLAASHLGASGTGGNSLDLPAPSHSFGSCNRVATPAETSATWLDPPHPSPNVHFKFFFFLAIQTAVFQPLTLLETLLILFYIIKIQSQGYDAHKFRGFSLTPPPRLSRFPLLEGSGVGGGGLKSPRATGTAKSSRLWRRRGGQPSQSPEASQPLLGQLGFIFNFLL